MSCYGHAIHVYACAYNYIHIRIRSIASLKVNNNYFMHACLLLALGVFDSMYVYKSFLFLLCVYVCICILEV